jgi:hypothetical protein
MITYNDFKVIDEEVKASVVEAFDYLKYKSMYYVLFLANGDYRLQYEYSHLRLNPYIIDNREDRYRDKDRAEFYIEFMRELYSFPDGRPTVDDVRTLHLELMIYTHIWEAKAFLKLLYRLSLLMTSKLYPWDVSVPNDGKHELIRVSLRDVFKSKGLMLSNIITKGFQTSLRNAFAHSEYSFNTSSSKIMLYGNGKERWQLPEVTFDEWSQRFCYTVLFAYHFNNEFFLRRKSLITDYGTDKFVIMLPMSKNVSRATYIRYDDPQDSFYFEN